MTEIDDPRAEVGAIAKGLSEMLTSYVECALWSSTDDEEHDNEPLDDAAYSGMELSGAARWSMLEDVAAFATDNARDLLSIGSWAQHGHDFWLTRNGHGAGFWDRGYGEVGERLTAACKPYGSSNLWVNHEAKLIEVEP